MSGIVGPQTLSSGVVASPNLDERGNLIAAVGGKYKEATLAGRMYAVTSAKSITTDGMALTHTGLAICNPLTSAKNLIMCGFSVGSEAAVTVAAQIGLMVGTGCAAATAAIAIQNRLTNGPASSAYADSAVVFTGTPVLHQIVCNASTEATTDTTSISPPQCLDLDGSLVIGPGGYVATYTSEIVTAASLLFGFIWEERDV